MDLKPAPLPFRNISRRTLLRLVLPAYGLLLAGLGGYLAWPRAPEGALRVDKVALEPGGTRVRIEGEGFGPATRVSLGLDLSNRHDLLHTLPTWGRGGGVERVEDRLYLAQATQGLVIFDLAAGGRPQAVGALPLPGVARRLVVADGIAYVVCHKAGLAVVDVADPSAPKLLNLLSDINQGQGLAIRPGRLYVGELVSGGGFGLVEVDVTDPGQPKILRRLSLPGAPLDLALWGEGVLVAAGKAGLIGIDLEGERLRERFRIPLQGKALGLSVLGARAYVACGLGGLSVVELAGPEPRLAAQVPLAGDSIHVAAEGHRLLVGGGVSGVQVFDLERPGRPRPLGRFDLDGGILGLALRGNLAYLSTTNDGLKVFDVSTPTLNQIGRHGWERERPSVLARAADLLLVGTSQKKLLVLQEKGDFGFRQLSELNLPGSPEYIQAAGNRVYLGLADFGPAWMDLSDPAAPRLAATYPWGEVVQEPYSSALALAPSGALGAAIGPSGRLHLFQVMADGGLRIRPGPDLPGRSGDLVWAKDRLYLSLDGGRSVAAVDVGPDGRTVVHPPFALNVPTVNDMAVMGERVILACGLEGLLVLDFSRPENPRLLAAAPLEISAHKVRLSGTTAFVSSARGGVQMVELSDPTRPVPGAMFDDPVRIDDFMLFNDRILLAAGVSGLLSVPVPRLLVPRKQTSQVLTLDLPPIDVSGRYTLHLAGGSQSLTLPGVLALEQR